MNMLQNLNYYSATQTKRRQEANTQSFDSTAAEKQKPECYKSHVS